MNRRINRRLMSIGLAMTLVLLGMALPAPTRAAAVNFSVPFNATVFVPCAGEDVDLSGPLHVQLQFVANNAGGGHLKIQLNAQGISGVGLTSGDKYRGTGVFRFAIASSGPVDHFSLDGHFQVIGQGPGNNLRVHFTFHVTDVNTPNGPTVVVENVHITCG